MTLSPRESLAASLSPTEILARDKEGFPQKSCITFGEVVSTFSRYGSVASKRHGGIYISKSLKIPNRYSTISDNTLKLEPNCREFGDASRFSPRSSVRTAPLARSRTPSPCSRRPRSLPVTPRSAPASALLRPREPPERLKEGRPSLPAEPIATSSFFNRGNPGGSASAAVTPSCHGAVTGTGAGTGGSSGRHALKAKISTPCLSCANPSPPDANYCRHCGVKRAGQSADYPSPRSPCGQALGPGQPPVLRSGPYGQPNGTYREWEPQENWSMDYRLASPKGNPRVSSFVRLNGFLLRTHMTSLLSALAEDGWLEAWEKDRLCCHARDSANPWAQSFLRIYMRFMETEDVAGFVAALKAQAAG